MKLTKEILKEMVIKEMKMNEATFGSVKRRVNTYDQEKTSRTAKEFVVMSSDRGERSPAENKEIYKQFKQKLNLLVFHLLSLLVNGSKQTKKQERKEKFKKILLLFTLMRDQMFPNNHKIYLSLEKVCQKNILKKHLFMVRWSLPKLERIE